MKPRQREARLPTPRPPIRRDTDAHDAVLTPRKTIWLIAIALFSAALLWTALYQVKSTAEDRVLTPAERAQCVADLDPAGQASVDEACPTEPDVKWAAQEPLRNAAIVFVLLLIAGYLTLVVDHKVRASGSGVRS